MERKIWSVILAAGESRRMGFPKMLLKLDGKTMLESVIRNVADSESDGILVVLGAYCDVLADISGSVDVMHCINGNYRQGMLSSVQCGIRNLPSGTGAAMIFQGDQPFILPGTINKVIKSWRESDKGIVSPLFDGVRGHPLLIDSRYFDEIDFLDPEEGLRAITRIHSDDIYEVETGDPGILRDIDTIEDYLRETNQN